MVYEQLWGTPKDSMVYDLFEGFWWTHINSLSSTMILINHCFAQPGNIMKHPRHGWGMTLVLFSGAINSCFPAIPTTTVSWILYPYLYILYIYIYMMFVCVVYAPKTARKNAFTSLTIIYIHGHKPSYWVSARRADIAAWTCRGAWQCIPRVEPESIGSSMSRAKQKAGNTYGIAEITFTNNWHKYDCWILEGWI